jgi:hypothetical protein
MNQDKKETRGRKRGETANITLTANPLLRPFAFVHVMNMVFGEKRSNEPFIAQDINGYILRGKLPDEYGGYPIVLYKSTGIKGRIVQIIDEGKLLQAKKNRDELLKAVKK